jgi:hypothetical protein
VQLLLGHKKIESTARYLGIEVLKGPMWKSAQTFKEVAQFMHLYSPAAFAGNFGWTPKPDGKSRFSDPLARMVIGLKVLPPPSPRRVAILTARSPDSALN